MSLLARLRLLPRPLLLLILSPLLPLLLPVLTSSYLLLLLSSPLARLLAPLRSAPSTPTPPFWAFRARLAYELAALKWVARAAPLIGLVLRAAWVGAVRGGRVRRTIQYTSERTGHVTVYPPSETRANKSPAPVLVLLHGVYYGPLRFRAWMLAPIAYRLSSAGYCVIVPSISLLPGSMETSIHDLRTLLSWVSLTAPTFHASPSALYVLGHGLGAHLPLLLTVQSTAVRSRANQAPGTPVPNGLRECRVYGGEVGVPRVEGLILLAPIADAQKHVEHEAQHAPNLSPSRAVLGPTLKTALFHSPAHLLFAARQVLDVSSLPRFLFIHGGEDEVVGVEQTEVMSELLVGAGVRDVRARMYRWMGHAEALTCLAGEGYYSEKVLREVMAFAPLE